MQANTAEPLSPSQKFLNSNFPVNSLVFHVFPCFLVLPQTTMFMGGGEIEKKPWKKPKEPLPTRGAKFLSKMARNQGGVNEFHNYLLFIICQ